MADALNRLISQYINSINCKNCKKYNESDKYNQQNKFFENESIECVEDELEYEFRFREIFKLKRRIKKIAIKPIKHKQSWILSKLLVWGICKVLWTSTKEIYKRLISS